MNSHYADMVVKLRKEGFRHWEMTAEVNDKKVATSVMLDVDDAEAMRRATELAGWFGAEMVVEGSALLN